MMTRTIVQSLGAIRDHLIAFCLPEPFRVDATSQRPDDDPRVTVHVATTNLDATARTLLAWADTLIDVQVELWRPPHGDTVHLSVHGLLTEGTMIRVYGGVLFDSNLFTLQSGETTSSTLDEMRTWAKPGVEGAVA